MDQIDNSYGSKSRYRFYYACPKYVQIAIRAYKPSLHDQTNQETTTNHMLSLFQADQKNLMLFISWGKNKMKFKLNHAMNYLGNVRILIYHSHEPDVRNPNTVEQSQILQPPIGPGCNLDQAFIGKTKTQPPFNDDVKPYQDIVGDCISERLARLVH